MLQIGYLVTNKTIKRIVTILLLVCCVLSVNAQNTAAAKKRVTEIKQMYAGVKERKQYLKDAELPPYEMDITNEYMAAVSFSGNYDPVSLAANDPTMLFMDTGNKLCYPNQANTINAFRAYLRTNTIGDVNGDGTDNVTDVTLLVNHILGVQDENVVVKNLDINGDKMVSVSDVTALVNIILNGNNILKVVANGADGITFGGAGNGPARAQESILWEEE